MGRRRKGEDEHENHERWLVSYADFITLLFAFFVVMYALSSVNEGKYRILSDSISSAFRNVPGSTVGAIVQINPNAPLPIGIPIKKPPLPNIKPDAAREKNREVLRNKAKEITAALAPLVQQGQVRVTEGALGITVEINASVLFDSGEARLQTPAVRALTAVGQILATTDFPITVEGHTDNAPINTPLFPSNWELSGARAASVVRLFIDTGVNPRSLTATGYAEQRPIADNANAEGRQRNRRVAINMESRTPDQIKELALPE
ncbi:MAG: flagellar motor protein MotD [Gammaproteobacteria bacterium]|nr:flagellar motor protein MotD [Rhodocyclaceae bacterium]MBU3909509.1 flagellar motor protein MotD [Gammaproteobacteria bacterium]MBU3987806.1 flagellar motor protein MotD [Gammaproteobacteria bacterium]MBU4003172.1 flagellar motor protein MotD [Gammaproteobacteria bacterium]MBU4022221.1 flagellar motor protein MotD [Gammaproteobacteria bacterium]